MNLEYEIKYSFDPETGQVVAEIPEFSLADYGETFEEAERNIMAALKAYLEYLLEIGKPVPKISEKEVTLLKVAV